jgi:nucleolar protein 4
MTIMQKSTPNEVGSTNLLRKRKEIPEGGRDVSKTRKKQKKKSSSGEEVVDKLDKLIEQYRSKFKNKQDNSNKTKDASKTSHGKVRRWFETSD